MHHFFAEPGGVKGDRIELAGPDVNHIKNVLRMKPGEELLISDGSGQDYRCCLESLEGERVRARILEKALSRELPAELWLFQGLPKGDKMELIIQKAVELGACAVVPVATKNAVVKLDEKKARAKTARWQAIAESAAKQSKRSRIPQVGRVMGFSEALSYIEETGFDLCLIPYENEEGMEGARQAVRAAAAGMKIAVFIGPEGGFDGAEIERAKKAGVRPVSLGKRILRTETAGLALLSVLMMKLEGGL